MKRYWLFYGEQYYPIGGMEDFHGQFDTIAEAQAVFEALIGGALRSGGINPQKLNSSNNVK